MLDDYRPLLEEKGFRVEIRPTDETVFADRRGLCFLLGQVVSNSVKYTLEKPVLTFSLESNDTATVLSIRDNGPGVRACDLPYVFEKGFTGDSGHEKNKATGMGLYLAALWIAGISGMTTAFSSARPAGHACVCRAARARSISSAANAARPSSGKPEAQPYVRICDRKSGGADAGAEGSL